MNSRYERYQYIYGSTARAAEVPEQEPERSQTGPQKKTKTPVRKKVKPNPKVLEFNSRFTAVLAVSITIVVLFCLSFLYGQSILHDRMSNIARKQTILSTLKSENQSLAANLEKKVDYDAIKEQAAELGMIVPTEQDTIYYEGTPSDYVRQYAEIPES